MPQQYQRTVPFPARSQMVPDSTEARMGEPPMARWSESSDESPPGVMTNRSVSPPAIARHAGSLGTAAPSPSPPETPSRARRGFQVPGPRTGRSVEWVRQELLLAQLLHLLERD